MVVETRGQMRAKELQRSKADDVQAVVSGQDSKPPVKAKLGPMDEKSDEKRDEDLKDAESLNLKFRVFDPAQALKRLSRASITPARPSSGNEVGKLKRLAERGLDWFDGRVVKVELLDLLKGMGLQDAFDRAETEVKGAGKADSQREGIVRQFEAEAGRGGSSKNKKDVTEWMGEMSECVGDRGTKFEWVDRHAEPLLKEEITINVDWKPDSVLVAKTHEGCKELRLRAVLVFAEFTNMEVTLKEGNKLHLKNLQAVMNGTLVFNAQSYRHYVLVLSFTKHDLFVFLLDRERVQVATISRWKDGHGFLTSCALVHTLEHARHSQLGFPPYLTIDEKTNEPTSIDLGLLAKLSEHHSSTIESTSKTTTFPPLPPNKKPSTHSPNDPSPPTNPSPSNPSPSSLPANPPLNFNSVPTIILLRVVSSTRNTGPFASATWVGGNGKGLFVKISSPPKGQIEAEPTVLTKLHEQVDPSYLGHEIPELVGSFLEDPALRSVWRFAKKLADKYENVIPRATEILITVITDAGVGHRDVSPDNARAKEDGRATLFDFGAGAMLRRDTDGRRGEARKSGWTGTMATMAPNVLSAMARPLEDFYHRPHHDVISLVNLFWYSVSKRVFKAEWEAFALARLNTLPATSTSQSQASKVKKEMKFEEVTKTNAAKASTFRAEDETTAVDILRMFAWDEGNPRLARMARINLWSTLPGTPAVEFLKVMKNKTIKKALRKILHAEPLRRIAWREASEEEEEEEEEEEKEEEEKEKEEQKAQKKVEARFTEEALKDAIDEFRRILNEARESYDGKGWDGVALTQSK
ncbi:hypothetical protein MNV49_005734 [Pseudohyphozyma bogoriensis]|nr:hypothetical protein MNV49_005734 [Pseudohyphozyma bogoriensis]